MSDSVRPHRQQPIRLRCPWDFPGKNTGVGCHFLPQCLKVKSLSCVQLLATPWTAAYQAPPSMGFSRQEYWSGVPLPIVYCLVFRNPDSMRFGGVRGCRFNVQSKTCFSVHLADGKKCKYWTVALIWSLICFQELGYLHNFSPVRDTWIEYSSEPPLHSQ